jgi:hypothetical protein
MIPQRQPVLLKEQGYRWLASLLSLWLALFYPLICAPYGSESYEPILTFNIFDHTVASFSPVTHSAIVQPDHTIRYLRATESVSATPWPFDSREDTSGLVMSFIDGITLPSLSWMKPAQPYQTIALLHTQSHKRFHASPPDKPPRLTLI